MDLSWDIVSDLGVLITQVIALELGLLDIASYLRLYGISGILVVTFGTRSVWEMQAEVLGCRNHDTAMAFRKSVQDESTTCAVAVIEPHGSPTV